MKRRLPWRVAMCRGVQPLSSCWFRSARPFAVSKGHSQPPPSDPRTAKGLASQMARSSSVMMLAWATRKWKTFRPWASRTVTTAPASISNFSVCPAPLEAASRSGVRPSPSFASTSAPSKYQIMAVFWKTGVDKD